MSKRQFSMEYYWNKTAQQQKPLMSYQAGLPFAKWQAETHEKLLELLGAFPEPVEPAAETDYAVEEQDFFRERVVFDSEAEMSVPCQLLIPKGQMPAGGFPAVLCCHGHGTHTKGGKDLAAGLAGTAEMRADVREMNCNYGAQLARAGFVTLCPDLRGFGERYDGPDPLSRDTCNVHYLKGSLMGRYPLTLNIWDLKCCVDYLCARPEVNPARIGMMGLSLGGTMTVFTTAVELRIKAADCIAYVNPFDRFGIANGNFCGEQLVPGLRRFMDTADIAGLIAPRPLLMEMGTADQCFPFHDLWKGYERVREIYKAAGAGAQLWTDIHPGGHAFSGRRAAEFFKEALAETHV